MTTFFTFSLDFDFEILHLTESSVAHIYIFDISWSDIIS